MRRSLVIIAVATMAAACATQSDVETSATSVRRDETRGLRAPREGNRTIRAKVPFVTSQGVVERDADVDETGHVWIGDEGFGSIDDMRPRTAGRRGLQYRWPGGVVKFVFQQGTGDDFRDIDVDPPPEEDDPQEPLRDRIIAAMRYIEARIPDVRFVELSPEAAQATHHVKIRRNGNQSRSRSEVGYLDSGLAGAFPQTTDIGSTAWRSTIIHELGHLLGLRHEQERPDRDTYIEVCADNATESDPYSKLSANEVDLLAPYDWNSCMHYGAGNFLKEEGVDTSQCGGMTMAARPNFDTVPEEPGMQTVLGKNGNYSRHDINALFLMYSGNAGALEAGDMMGHSVVVADFDDDGFDDMAVGGPGEKVGSGPDNAGVVYVFKGTSKGLVHWTNLEMPGAGAGDMLGTTLAVGDFNGDGIADLAASAPYRTMGSVRSGSVRVWKGGRHRGARFVTDCPSGTKCEGTAWLPLEPFRSFNVLNGGFSPEANEHFGASIRFADLDDDGKAELVVGAPGRASRNGRVFVIRGVDFAVGDGFVEMALLPVPSGITDGELGQSLGSGDFDGDGIMDLAVGAPNVDGRGKVFTFRGRRTSFVPTPSNTISAPTTAGPGARFGAALATGKLFGTRDDLVVSATREMSSAGVAAGAVHVYTLSAITSPSFFSHRDAVTSGSSSTESFGASLAVFDENGDGLLDLAVGAPANSGGKGRVVILRSNGTSLAKKWDVFPTLAGGGFGTSLAIGTMGHRSFTFGADLPVRLVVGTPYDDTSGHTNAGVVWGHGFDTSGPRMLFLLDQDTKSPWSE